MRGQCPRRSGLLRACRIPFTSSPTVKRAVRTLPRAMPGLRRRVFPASRVLRGGGFEICPHVPAARGYPIKAVTMAVGRTRLRPLTSDQPKPMIPIVNLPCMEHVVGLLERHGFTDITLTLQFLPDEVGDYFGD